jgi:hypothetical protein
LQQPRCCCSSCTAAAEASGGILLPASPTVVVKLSRPAAAAGLQAADGQCWISCTTRSAECKALDKTLFTCCVLMVCYRQVAVTV